MLFKADNLTGAEKTLLQSYFNTTRNIAGCQALRRRMGHCLLGMRVVYGEPVFVTLSPNRRHSSLILKLSRVRRHDVGLRATDTCTQARRRFCGPDEPPVFVNGFVTEDDADVEKAETLLNLPSLRDRQGMNAQDPLSSVHYYLACVYILLPATFGLRMCLNCLHCNMDEHDPKKSAATTSPCQDLLGRNAKPMGGYAGLAETMGFANELQGDGTLHGHGFVVLSNVYQYSSLQDITNLINANSEKLTPEQVVQRFTGFYLGLRLSLPRSASMNRCSVRL